MLGVFKLFSKKYCAIQKRFYLRVMQNDKNMKTFQITFLENGKSKTAKVQATDKRAASSQASIQGVCHWSEILEVKQV